MSEQEKNQTPQQEYSLNDDRRVKVLSPGRLVLQRFIRNRVAVTGLIILAFMFVFSFLGGWISPYKENDLFYRYDEQSKQYAGVTENKELRYVESETGVFPTLAQAQFYLARTKGDEHFEYRGTIYTYKEEGEDFYSIYTSNSEEPIAFASMDIISSSTGNEKVPFMLQYQLLKALMDKKDSFELDGETYDVSEDGSLSKDGKEIAYASRYVVRALMSDIFLTRQFRDELIEEIEKGKTEFTFTDADGETYDYTITYNAATNAYSVMQSQSTKVFDTYSPPSKAHWLGTDRNGMDMLTRLMYGGRVSLYIGFIVVIIESLIGVVLGGISGYFGGWVDNLIMRIVDIFYCIPSLPIIIILGAAMDAMRMDPQIRMVWLMLILGFLGWAGIARLVRGQILSLREQEFMTATEATGLKVSRRIFKHLIPNVIPQLIVTMTMSLGSTILIEATLSFLGLGVKFPFASWGNIINDVNNTYVLTNFWFIWIPAGICLVATVLAFNLVGDGLRDAFDPKMKR
ncbi:MAG: ABC transporter permease [Lachnospiraceae bacterium]|nr:ABC transporter permease [Lachnospiraceae bacterium]